MHGVRPVLGHAVFFCTELLRYRMLRGRCSAGSTGFSPGRTDTAHSSATPYRVMVRSTFCAVRDTKTRPLSYNWLQVFSALYLRSKAHLARVASDTSELCSMPSL